MAMLASGARRIPLLRSVRAMLSHQPARCAGGGHGHGHSGHGDHHESGHGHMSAQAAAYEAETPRLWGEPTRAKGESRPREAWEGSFYFLLAGTALVVALGAYKPNVNVRDWARDEASERVRRGAAGLEVQPGVNYSGLRLLKEAGALSEDEAAALEAGAIPAPARSLA